MPGVSGSGPQQVFQELGFQAHDADLAPADHPDLLRRSALVSPFHLRFRSRLRAARGRNLELLRGEAQADTVDRRKSTLLGVLPQAFHPLATYCV